MKTTSFRSLGLLTVLVMLSWACNLSGGAPAEPTTAPTQGVVEAASATSLPPTDTPAPPTETPPPAVTATETLTPQPSLTPTVEVPVAEVTRETNCRSGPAGAYELVATYQAGQKLNIIARDLGGGFVFVQNPERPEEQCYVLESNIKISGDLAALPRFTPPPSPTSAPSFTVEFWKYGLCKDFYVAHFTVVNTGSSQFRSAYVKVTDQKQQKSVEQSLNAFDLYDGCVVAKNIAPLLPGGTGYVQSAYYKWDPRPNKQTAVIMLCTDQGLKGVCITKTLEFKNK